MQFPECEATITDRAILPHLAFPFESNQEVPKMFAFQSPARQPETDHQNAGGNRRQFLGQAGTLAGALVTTGLMARRANGQSDEPENCSPPVPTGAAIPFQPDPAA